MKTGTLFARVLIGLIVVAVVASTAFAVGAAYQRGLGPALNIAPIATLTSAPPVVIAEATSTQTPILPTSTAVETAVCGETSAWNMLILGADTVALRGDVGADLTRMMRLDFPNRKVVIYAFPRELWVDTSGLGLTNPTINATELGTVFYEAFLRSIRATRRDAMINATSTTARMLSWNFSVRTDHYVTVDVSQVPAMIDAIGGIPIYIPVRTTDPWIGMVFQPGQQTLNGTQAVAYARAKPDSDFGRIDRQQLLLEAIRTKLLDPAVWVKIPQLYSQFNQVIATDLSPEQINHLACLLNEVPREAIIQLSVNPGWTTPGPGGSLLWDKNSVMSQLMGLGLVP